MSVDREPASRHEASLRERVEFWLWERLRALWRWENRWNHRSYGPERMMPWCRATWERLPWLCDLADWLTGGRAHD